MGKREHVETTFGEAEALEISELLKAAEKREPKFRVTVVTAEFPPGEQEIVFVKRSVFQHDNIGFCRREADRLQAEFDADCAPVRVCVFDGQIGVYAGLAANRHRRNAR
jgi:hypothetical protein